MPWYGWLRGELVCKADTIDGCHGELNKIMRSRGITRSLDACMTAGGRPPEARAIDEAYSVQPAVGAATAANGGSKTTETAQTVAAPGTAAWEDL
jgi:hypothetical protein